MAYQQKKGVNQFDVHPQVQTNNPKLNVTTRVSNHIFMQDFQMGKALISPDADWHVPIWQVCEICAKWSTISFNPFCFY